MQEGFGITLDKNALKTPSKNPLVLPNKALALAVAAEWRWQVAVQPLSASFPDESCCLQRACSGD